MRGPGPRPHPEQRLGEQRPVCAAVGDPGHIRLGERSQMQKAAHCTLPFTGSDQNGRIHTKRQNTDERLHRLGGWGSHGGRLLTGRGFCLGMMKVLGNRLQGGCRTPWLC